MSAHATHRTPLASLSFAPTEKATSSKINWRKFDNGGDIVTAMASGELQIGVAGYSRSLPLSVIWILNNINEAEEAVARGGCGINDPRWMCHPSRPRTAKRCSRWSMTLRLS